MQLTNIFSNLALNFQLELLHTVLVIPTIIFSALVVAEILFLPPS